MRADNEDRIKLKICGRPHHKEMAFKDQHLNYQHKNGRKSGMTLVELIVCLALISVFMLGSAAVISSAMDSYYQLRDTNCKVQLGDTLLDKINAILLDGSIREISEDGSSLYMKNTSGESLTICRAEEDGLLHVYYDNKLQTDEGDESKIGEDDESQIGVDDDSQMGEDDGLQRNMDAGSQRDWYYDASVYMGFELGSLKFYRPAREAEAYDENLIRVEITLTDPDKEESSYTVSRYVQCR